MKLIKTSCLIVEIIIFTSLLSACIQNNDSKNEKPKSKKNIHKIASLAFRKSYSNFNTLSQNEKDRIEKSNPFLMSPMNDYYKTIALKLDSYKIINNGKLNLNKIKQNISDTIYFDGNSKCVFEINNKSLMISILDSLIKTGLEIKCETPDIKVMLIDYIRGGTEEILVLNKWYFMNGYNYDLSIFEIK